MKLIQSRNPRTSPANVPPQHASPAGAPPRSTPSGQAPAVAAGTLPPPGPGVRASSVLSAEKPAGLASGTAAPETLARLGGHLEELYLGLSDKVPGDSSLLPLLLTAVEECWAGNFPQLNPHHWELAHHLNAAPLAEFFPFRPFKKASSESSANAKPEKKPDSEDYKVFVALADRVLRESPWVLPEFLAHFFPDCDALKDFARQAKIFSNPKAQLLATKEFHRQAYGLAWYGEVLAWQDYVREKILRGKKEVSLYEITEAAERNSERLDLLWSLGGWGRLDVDFWLRASRLLGPLRKVEVEVPAPDPKPVEVPRKVGTPRLLVGDIGPLPTPKVKVRPPKVQVVAPEKATPRSRDEALELLCGQYRSFRLGSGRAFVLLSSLLEVLPLVLPERQDLFSVTPNQFYEALVLQVELQSRLRELVGIEEDDAFQELLWAALVEYHIDAYDPLRVVERLQAIQRLGEKLEKLPLERWKLADIEKLLSRCFEFMPRFTYKSFPHLNLKFQNADEIFKVFDYLSRIFGVPARFTIQTMNEAVVEGCDHFMIAEDRAKVMEPIHHLARHLQEERSVPERQVAAAQQILACLHRLWVATNQAPSPISQDKAAERGFRPPEAKDAVFFSRDRQELHRELALPGAYGELTADVLFDLGEATVDWDSAAPRASALETSVLWGVLASEISLLLRKDHLSLEDAVEFLGKNKIESGRMVNAFKRLAPDYFDSPRTLDELRQLAYRVGILRRF